MILCYILLYDCLFLLENDQNIPVLCLRREGISRFREVFSIVARDVNILGGISILVLSSCALCTCVASAAAHKLSNGVCVETQKGTTNTGLNRMLQVYVSFASGRGESVSLPATSTVRDLKILAHNCLRQGFLRLVKGDGSVLPNSIITLLDAGIQDGEHLTVVVQQVKVSASTKAFAVWCYKGDGIVTWGNPSHGGDSSAVQDRLKNVKQIQATCTAFAAILADGSVVAWGDPDYGCDCSAFQDQLRNVREIQAASAAFAAILADGSVITWGCLGADNFANQTRPRQIQATGGAFAAILADGSVVAWGDPNCGGDCSVVQDRLKNVKQIQATCAAFAAILADGSVVTWGSRGFGGKSSVVQDQLRNVQRIQTTGGAFAAILADGSVVSCGDPTKGGNSSAVGELRNVQDVQATSYAFAATLADGSVVTWGDLSRGGDNSDVQDQIQGL